MKHRRKRALKNYQRQCAIQKEREELIKRSKAIEEMIKLYIEQRTEDPKVLEMMNAHTSEISYVTY